MKRREKTNDVEELNNIKQEIENNEKNEEQIKG